MVEDWNFSPPNRLNKTNSTNNMYSADINFFLSHQIAVVTTNSGKAITFFSRLTGTRFKKVHTVQPFTDQDILNECRTIHRNMWAAPNDKSIKVKKIMDERTSRLSGFNLVALGSEIQVGRSTMTPHIFYIRKYEGVALVHDKILNCENWSQAYIEAKTYL